MTIFISLFSSIIGGIVSAFITHQFATKRNQKNDLSKFQIQAYSNFIGSASKLAVSRRIGNTENEINDLAELNDAKNRILVCGDKEVIQALIKYWEKGATLELESQILAFRNLTQLIRNSLGHKQNDILDLEISDAQFRLEPSSYSFKSEHGKS